MGRHYWLGVRETKKCTYINPSIVFLLRCGKEKRRESEDSEKMQGLMVWRGGGGSM